MENGTRRRRTTTTGAEQGRAGQERGAEGWRNYWSPLCRSAEERSCGRCGPAGMGESGRVGQRGPLNDVGKPVKCTPHAGCQPRGITGVGRAGQQGALLGCSTSRAPLSTIQGRSNKTNANSMSGGSGGKSRSCGSGKGSSGRGNSGGVGGKSGLAGGRSGAGGSWGKGSVPYGPIGIRLGPGDVLQMHRCPWGYFQE